MLVRSRLLLVALLAYAATLLSIAPASAAAGLCNGGQGAFGPVGYVVSLAPSGTSAIVGQPHTIVATVTDARGGAITGFCIDFLQNAGPSTGWPRNATTDAKGNASVTWTSAAVGTDSITAGYHDDSNAFISATIRHTWTPKPKPTPSATRSPTASPTPSATPSATPSPTPTHSPTPSPTPSPTLSPKPSATPSQTPSPTADAPHFGDGSVQVNRPSALPGGSAGLSGRNCPPSAPVTYTVEGTPAGSTTSKPDGTFDGTVQLPDTTIGEHVITVTCGGGSAAVRIDLVVASSVSSPATGATAAAVLVFFVLLGSVLFARTSSTSKPAPEQP